MSAPGVVDSALAIAERVKWRERRREVEDARGMVRKREAILCEGMTNGVERIWCGLGVFVQSRSPVNLGFSLFDLTRRL